MGILFIATCYSSSSFRLCLLQLVTATPPTSVPATPGGWQSPFLLLQRDPWLWFDECLRRNKLQGASSPPGPSPEPDCSPTVAGSERLCPQVWRWSRLRHHWVVCVVLRACSLLFSNLLCPCTHRFYFWQIDADWHGLRSPLPEITTFSWRTSFLLG